MNGGRLDFYTASREQFLAVPYLGEARVTALWQWRESRDRLRSDKALRAALEEVSGIGPKIAAIICQRFEVK